MKTLIIDDVHPILIEKLSVFGIDVNYRPEISKDDFFAILPKIEILVVRSKFKIDKEIFDKGKKLKLIARAGAGMDNIDVIKAYKHKVELINAPEGNRNAVAEHTLGMLLSLLNKINHGNDQIRNGKFNREGNRGEELSGKTVGIIGYGNTGQAFAKLLSSFDVKVLAFDLYKKDFSDEYAQETEMHTIYKDCDVVSIHVPLDEFNQKYFDKEFYLKFEKPIFLINTSRGELLSFEILNSLIDQCKIKGFGLDVFENEKFENFSLEQKSMFNRLKAHSFGVFTPHVAGWTKESYLKISEILTKKIIFFVTKTKT